MNLTVDTFAAGKGTTARVPVFKRPSRRWRWYFFGAGEVRRPIVGKDYVQVGWYTFSIPYGGMQP